MSSKVIQQGAEAEIILSETEEGKFVIKDRIKKSYRLVELDKQIRVRRTRSEMKLLKKASEIINSPEPVAEKKNKNLTRIKMPYIEGQKLSESLNDFPLKTQKQICKIIGQNISKIHDAGLIHGDLTTSNMILVKDNEKSNSNNGRKLNSPKDVSALKTNKRKNMMESVLERHQSASQSEPKNFKVFFIDFGLGFHSLKIEDKAVDLHLLRQALEAKHFKNWKTLFKSVLTGYSKSEDYKKVIEQFKKVESRGRYKESY